MASTLPDPDSTPGNGKAGEDDQASVALNSKGVADLSLSNKLVSSGSRVGTQAVYKLTVHNAGPDTASGVIVRDQLPDGLSFVAAEGGKYDPHTGVWSVGELAVGASVSLTLTTQIGAAGSITNVAEVAASDQRDPNSTPGNAEPRENDQSSAGLAAGLATLPPTATIPLLPASPGGLALWLLGSVFAAAALLGTLTARSRRRLRN